MNINLKRAAVGRSHVKFSIIFAEPVLHLVFYVLEGITR